MVEESFRELINYGALGIILVLVMLATIYIVKKAFNIIPKIATDAIQAYKDSQKEMSNRLDAQTKALIDLTQTFITQYNDLNIEIGHVKEDVEDIKDLIKKGE